MVRWSQTSVTTIRLINTCMRDYTDLHEFDINTVRFLQE